MQRPWMFVIKKNNAFRSLEDAYSAITTSSDAERTIHSQANRMANKGPSRDRKCIC